MSNAFFNKNSKLSSSEIIKREGFRNKYMLINNTPDLLMYRSSVDNKKYNYQDYNYIRSQRNIMMCLSGNRHNDRITKYNNTRI